MKKFIWVGTTSIAILILAIVLKYNYWRYDAPTPCFGKKTNWTQAEVENYFMRRVYGNAKRHGHVSYQSFREHPGTVLVFSKDRHRHKKESLKGLYVLVAWFEVLEGDKTGIIEEQGESYSKCLRLSGRHGWRFVPTKNNYKTAFYLDLVTKKNQSINDHAN